LKIVLFISFRTVHYMPKSHAWDCLGLLIYPHRLGLGTINKALVWWQNTCSFAHLLWDFSATQAF